MVELLLILMAIAAWAMVAVSGTWIWLVIGFIPIAILATMQTRRWISRS